MSKPPLIITCGDPGGIGFELLLKSLVTLGKTDSPLLVVGSIGAAEAAAKTTGIHLASVFDEISENKNSVLSLMTNREHNSRAGILLDPAPGSIFKTGVIEAGNGRIALACLDVAIEILAKFGNKGCLLTLPVNKKSVSLVNCGFSGHTEYLRDKTGSAGVTMIMHSEKMSVSLVTTHVPVCKLDGAITCEIFSETAQRTGSFMKALNMKGRIGLLALNPHASDDGIIGCEETTWIRDELSRLRRACAIDISDPISADTAFSGYRDHEPGYRVYIAWYHDQGLIPFKIISAGKGANITWGLPFFRISPDHGTGFDIVGKGIARTDSLDFCLQTALTALNGITGTA